MARKTGKKAGRSRQKKLSRFNLSRKGETALAVVGVLILVGAAALLWAALSPRILPQNPGKAAREKAEAAALEARWESMQREGVVTGVAADRETILVDAAKWNALLPTERGPAAEAACAHHRWPRCFVIDGATRERVGWYTPGDGYRPVAPGGK